MLINHTFYQFTSQIGIVFYFFLKITHYINDSFIFEVEPFLNYLFHGQHPISSASNSAYPNHSGV
jgi:hypothetical protein